MAQCYGGRITIFCCFAGEKIFLKKFDFPLDFCVTQRIIMSIPKKITKSRRYDHEKGKCHDPIRERAACRSRIFAQKVIHQRAGAAGGTAQMSLRIRGAGAGAGISRQPRGARCPSPPSGKTDEAADAGGASLCIGTACR